VDITVYITHNTEDWS